MVIWLARISASKLMLVEARERFFVVPRQPIRRGFDNGLVVLLEHSEVVERISAVHLGGVDKGHEDVADPGAAKASIEE